MTFYDHVFGCENWDGNVEKRTPEINLEEDNLMATFGIHLKIFETQKENEISLTE